MLAVLIFVMYATRPDHTPAATNEAVYTAVDFSFTGPESLPAGWTNFHIENRGSGLHHILLIQLMDGKTRANFEEAFKSDPMMTKPPSWVRFAGGPNAITPGDVETATVNLESGH